MTTLRRLAALPVALSLAVTPAAVLAHTELESSDPPDGAVLAEAPDEVVVTFTGELEEDAAFTVTDANGTVVGTGSLDLEAPDRNVIRGTVTITEPGDYVVTFTAAAQDGHPAEGEVTFSVEPEGEATTPDTALPPPAGDGVTLAGIGLALVAVALGRRRVAGASG